ncbi:MAG: cation transporter [Bacteroidales bacterium]|nr:cation transporter [Bacteroidales bacterium]
MTDQTLSNITQNDSVEKQKPDKGFRLLLVTLLNLSISVVQVIGGLLSNSLSLLSDALHNLGDAASLFISYLAKRISMNNPDLRKTFGYKRIEILAAFFNGMLLIAICIYLFFEAFKRIIKPESVDISIMLPVAAFGFLINLISMFLLLKRQKENINIRTAFLHLLSDSLSSVAVITGAIVMWLTGIYWVDAVISVAVGIYIIYQAWLVVKETVDILMQSTPLEIDINQVRRSIEDIDEIENIHHVHVWRLNDSNIHFEAHIMLNRNLTMQEMMICKNRVEKILGMQFRISHITLQFEYGGCRDRELIVTDTR